MQVLKKILSKNIVSGICFFFLLLMFDIIFLNSLSNKTIIKEL